MNAITLKNRYQQLGEEMENETVRPVKQLSSPTKNTDNNSSTRTKTKAPKSPSILPIFIQGVNNFQDMLKDISSIIPTDAYTAKSLLNGNVCVNTFTADNYRTLVSSLRNKSTSFYTYQFKSERAFKVVIRNLHHSINTADIQDALTEAGFSVRNVANIKQWKTKEALPLFFVDLDPTENCKEIYNLKTLLHTVIKVGTPKPKHDIVQCKCCQRYGHTHSYCTLPMICVRCGENHDSRSCNRNKELPPVCALCSGDHTANYRGCPVYRKITAKPAKAVNLKLNRPSTTSENATTATSYATNLNCQSYAQVTAISAEIAVPSNLTNQTRLENLIEKILEQNAAQTARFEQLFSQLISQNSQTIGLLTTLINKLK